MGVGVVDRVARVAARWGWGVSGALTPERLARLRRSAQRQADLSAMGRGIVLHADHEAILALLDEREALRGALAFYADEENYYRRLFADGDSRPLVEADNGQRARAAMEGGSGGPHTTPEFVETLRSRGASDDLIDAAEKSLPSGIHHLPTRREMGVDAPDFGPTLGEPDA